MRQTTFATGLALVWCIGTLAAQRSPAPSALPEPAHKVYVLTGCLERGTAPSSFRLTRASAVGQAPAPASPDAKVDAYDLHATSSVSEQGFSSEKLLPEVGTRVEVTIRPVEVVAPAPPRSATSSGAEKPPEAPRPRYTVVALERLEGKCA